MGYKSLSTKIISTFLIASKLYAADIVQTGTTNSTITLSDNDTLSVQGTLDVSATSGQEAVIGAGDNTVTVESTATMTGPGGFNAHAFDFNSTPLDAQFLDFTNSGTIQTFTNGLYLDADNGSTIDFYNDGVFNSNGSALTSFFDNSSLDFINDGTITGSTYASVYVELSNNSDATIVNNGSVVNSGTSGYNLILDNSILNFTNNGTLTGNSSNLNVFLNGTSVATITNDGTISSATNSGVSILVSDSSQLNFTNESNLSSNTDDGLAIGVNDSAIASVTNNGIIASNGTYGVDIYADSGSTLNFTNSGSIDSNTTGGLSLYSELSGYLNAYNYGTIDDNGLGLYVEGFDNGNIYFENQGDILDNTNGIYVDLYTGSSFTFINNGNLDGVNAIEAYLYDDSSLNITNTGSIEGSTYGVYADLYGTSQANIINDGTIGQANFVNIYLATYEDSTANITNNGTLDGVNASDNVLLDANDNSIINFINNGDILGASSQGIEVVADEDSQVYIENYGSITADSDIIKAELEDNAYLSLINTALITGTTDGLDIEAVDDSSALINNSGEISNNTDDGIQLQVEDTASITLINSGLIDSNNTGLEIETDDDSQLTVINTGDITNNSLGIALDIFGDSVAYFQNDGDVLNNTSDGGEAYVEDNAFLEFINNGSISGNNEGYYVETINNATLIFTNNGIVSGNDDNGLYLYASNNGSVSAYNYGTISGNNEDGVRISTNSSEEFTFENYGTISDNEEWGIYVDGSYGSTVYLLNDGGTITGNTDGAIQFTDGMNTLSIQGFSVIDGLIDGGTDTDTLIFENLYLSADKIAELEALALADDASGSIEIYGETFEWQDFEDIQINNLESLDTLLMDTDSGLAAALANASITENPEIFEVLQDLSNYSDEEMRETLVDNLTGQDSLNFVSRDAVNFTRRQNRQFSNHFANVRAGYTGFASNMPKQYDFALPSYMQAGYSEPLVDTLDNPVDVVTHFNDWSGFLQVTGVKSEVDNNEVDSETDSYIATFGLDHRVNKNLIIGAYLGYSNDDARTDAFGSSLDVDGYSTGLYSHCTIGKTFIEGQLGLRYIDYNQERNIGLSSTTAHSDFSGRQFNSSWRIGHELNFGDKNKWAFTPQAALYYSYLYNESYTETGAGTLSLDVSSQESHSVRSELGFDLARTFNSSWASITPSLSLSWLHEYIDDASNVNSSFVGSTLNSFSVQSNAPETDFIVAAASVAIRPTANRDLSFALTLQHEEGNDSSQAQSLSLNARLEF